jgi:hypothetical protein
MRELLELQPRWSKRGNFIFLDVMGFTETGDEVVTRRVAMTRAIALSVFKDLADTLAELDCADGKVIPIDRKWPGHQVNTSTGRCEFDS